MPAPSAITPPNMPRRRGLRYDLTSKVKALLGSYGQLVSDIIGLGYDIDMHLDRARIGAGRELKDVFAAVTSDASYMFKRLHRYSKLLEEQKITRVQYIDLLGYVKKELSFIDAQIKDISGEKVVYLTKGRT